MIAVFQRELRVAFRSGRIYVAAGLYAMALGILVIHLWPDRSHALFGSRIGQKIFAQFRWLQIALVLCMAPAFTWSAISGEREAQTWTTLRTTPLSHTGIVFGKFLSASLQLLLFVSATLPITAYCFYLGGVSPGDVREAYISAFLSGATATSAGLACSALTRKTVFAVVIAYAWMGCLAFSLWPMHIHARTGAFLIGFLALAVALTHHMQHAWGLMGRTRNVPESSEEKGLPDTGNLVLARTFRATRIFRERILLGSVVIFVLVPVVGTGLLYPWGANVVRLIFPWCAGLEQLLVMVVAMAFSVYSLTSENENRTMPVLISTPISPCMILRGKLMFSLWHVVMIVLCAVPSYMLSAAWGAITWGEVGIVNVSFIIYGTVFAIVGLFVAVQMTRMHTAMIVSLTILVLTNLVSFQILPFIPSRYGAEQCVIASSPLHALIDGVMGQNATPPPRKRKRRGMRSEPTAIQTSDELPAISALAASIVGYGTAGGVLWYLSRRRFQQISM